MASAVWAEQWPDSGILRAELKQLRPLSELGGFVHYIGACSFWTKSATPRHATTANSSSFRGCVLIRLTRSEKDAARGKSLRTPPKDWSQIQWIVSHSQRACMVFSSPLEHWLHSGLSRIFLFCKFFFVGSASEQARHMKVFTLHRMAYPSSIIHSRISSMLHYLNWLPSLSIIQLQLTENCLPKKKKKLIENLIPRFDRVTSQFFSWPQ